MGDVPGPFRPTPEQIDAARQFYSTNADPNLVASPGPAPADNASSAFGPPPPPPPPPAPIPVLDAPAPPSPPMVARPGFNPTEQTDADAMRFMAAKPSVTPYANVNAADYFGKPAAAPTPSGWEGPNPVDAFEAGFNGGHPGVRQPVSISRGDTRDLGHARPASGGGGGGGNGDPYGLRAAQKGLRATYDDEKKAVQSGADAEKARDDVMAAGQGALAAQKAQDAADAHQEAQLAADHFRSYQEDTQRQLDDVRAQKIDPGRLYADGGSKFLAIIGGMVGGMYMGANKLTSNPFLDQMNKNIDRDIAVQEKNIANNMASVSERRSLLGDMRATYKDESLAKLQAKNLYYESAKEQLAAQAATFDSPIVQARADQAITALGREQAKLDITGAMQKAAQAQAAAAAKIAAAERARKADLEERHQRVAEGELIVKADEEHGKSAKKDSDSFVTTGTDPNTGAPKGFKARSPEEATKLSESLTASDELLANIQRAKAIRAEQGYTGRAGSKVVPFTRQWESEARSLEKEIGVGWSRAKPGMGTYDNGIERLTAGIVGDLDTVGGSADDRLNELERRVTASREKMLQHHAGAEGTKTVDDSGKEHIDPTGKVTPGPSNPKTAKRYDPEDGAPR
jgi:hypothetical protein